MLFPCSYLCVCHRVKKPCYQLWWKLLTRWLPTCFKRKPVIERSSQCEYLKASLISLYTIFQQSKYGETEFIFQSGKAQNVRNSKHLRGGNVWLPIVFQNGREVFYYGLQSAGTNGKFCKLNQPVNMGS